MASNKKHTSPLLFAVLCSIIICGIKFYTFWQTHSNAILSDAFESLINIIAGSFALYSVWLAAKPRDLNHPYGHGKIEFISAGLEGGLILLAGLIIIGKSIYSFSSSHTIQNIGLGLGLTFATGLANFLLGYYLSAKGKKVKSSAIYADGKHLMTDAYTSAALIIGLFAIKYTHLHWLDNLVAIVFGAYIFYTGFKLLRSSVAGVMDEADTQLLQDLIQHINKNRKSHWVDLHNLRVIKYGADLHVDCHLTLPWYFTIKEAHKEVDDFQDVVHNFVGENVEFFIHTDPCEPPDACRLCIFKDCKYREADFERKLEWDLDLVFKNQRHYLKKED